jgi:outer membrane protein TolC
MRRDFESVRRELALTAVGLFDQYFVAVRSLEINARHMELLRTLRDSATAEFEAGRGSAQDPLQAEAELAQVERENLMLTSRRGVTAAQMNELLHRPPEERLPPPPAELSLSEGPDSMNTAKLQTEALSTRPDIAAMRQRARAEQARADRAAREYYPDFSVSTSYNSMWDMPEHRWTVGLGFNLPIQTGRRAGAAEEARAMRAQFQNDAARLEGSARTGVFVAYEQLSESKRVLELFERRLLPVAKDQIDAARAGFITSRTPFIAVIEAQKNLHRVELDYQTARAECDRRHAELERALGRMPGLPEKERRR